MKTNDEMFGWHHQLSGHAFEQPPGQCEGQGSLACCSLWGLKEGTFHAKMGSIKDRNGMDLTEAEDIKKRWQEYT